MKETSLLEDTLTSNIRDGERSKQYVLLGIKNMELLTRESPSSRTCASVAGGGGTVGCSAPVHLNFAKGLDWDRAGVLVG